MHQLDEETKKMYQENPENLEAKRIMFFDYLEDRIHAYCVEHLIHPAFKKLEKMWEVATSYWIFPDLADIDKMLNDIWEQHRDKKF